MTCFEEMLPAVMAAYKARKSQSMTVGDNVNVHMQVAAQVAIIGMLKAGRSWNLADVGEGVITGCLACLRNALAQPRMDKDEAQRARVLFAEMLAAAATALLREDNDKTVILGPKVERHQ